MIRGTETSPGASSGSADPRAWLAAIVDSSDDAIIGKRLDGTIVSWNSAATRIFGYTADEILGQSVLMLIPADLREEEPRIIARLTRGERVDHYQTVRLRKDGSSIHVSLSVSPIRDDTGTIVGAAKIARDVTEQRRLLEQLQNQAIELEQQSEEAQSLAEELEQANEELIAREATAREALARFEGVFKSRVIGISVFDAEAGRTIAINDYLLDLIGYSRAEFESGDVDWRDVTPPEYLEAEERSLQQLVKHGSAGPLEKEYVRKDGERVPVAVSGAAIPGLAGQYAVFVEDITEQRRARAAIEAARAEAEQAAARAVEASRAKSEFLATMSHEFRTPLNAVVGYVQLFDMEIAGPITEQQRDYLARLRSSGQHLIGLINDILDFAKIDAGQLSVVGERGLTGDAVRAAIALALPQAQSQQIHIVESNQSQGKTDVAYVGDSHRVRQILLNLLSNAVKFSEPGGRVTVSSDTVEEAPNAAHLVGGGPWAFIKVEDTGIGIPPQMQRSIFEPFVQVESGMTRTRGGSGLGLAISRRLARLMGGDLTVESRPGVGSAFTLWLPAPATKGASESNVQRADRARGGSPAYAPNGLADVGTMLRRDLETLKEEWQTRLRADPTFAVVQPLTRVQVADHTLTLLADLTQALTIVDETDGLQRELLLHGSEIQRIIAALHGKQRQQVGFTEVQLTREYDILEEILETRVQRIANDRDDLSFAIDLLGRLVRLARSAAISGFRDAGEKSPTAL